MPDSRAIFRPIVPVYDLLNRLLSLGIDQSWRRRAALGLPAGQVLDIACGTGDLALADALRPGTRVFGTDILPEMLAVAARKNIARARKNSARKAAGRRNAMTAEEPASGETATRQVRGAEGHEGDGVVRGWAASAGERLPFGSARFDAVTIAFGIRNFVDRSAGLREMARVLKPGGSLFILEFGVPEFAPFRALYLFYFTRLLPFIGRLVAGNDRSYAYLPETVLAFPEPPAFADEMAAAGFQGLEIASLTGGIVRMYSGRRR